MIRWESVFHLIRKLEAFTVKRRELGMSEYMLRCRGTGDMI